MTTVERELRSVKRRLNLLIGVVVAPVALLVGAKVALIVGRALF